MALKQIKRPGCGNLSRLVPPKNTEQIQMKTIPNAWHRSWAVVAVLSLSVAGLATQSWAGDDDDEREVRGIISVNLAQSTVNVAGLTLSVTGDTEIEVNDDDTDLAGLSAYVVENPNSVAEAEFVVTGSGNVAAEIEIEDDEDDDDRDELKGVLTVDLVNSTVSVGGVPLSVTGATSIEVAGEDGATLADLDTYVSTNPGSFGEAHFHLEGEVRVADKIETKGSRDDDGDDDDEDENELYGLLSVDLSQRTVTIGSVLLAVTPGTEIERGNIQMSLEQLAQYLQANPGTHGKGEYRVLGKEFVAREIEVYGTGLPVGEVEVVGTVTAVNAGARTLDFSPANGQPVTLSVPVSAELELNGAELSLADLAIAIPVGVAPAARVHYDPTNLAIRELDVTIPVTVALARVTDVNARSGVLTVVTNNQGRSRTEKVTVLAGATIIKRGKVVRLKDLRQRDRVRINLFRSRNRKLSPELSVTR